MKFRVVSRVSTVCDLMQGTLSSSEAPSDLLEQPARDKRRKSETHKQRIGLTKANKTKHICSVSQRTWPPGMAICFTFEFYVKRTYSQAYN